MLLPEAEKTLHESINKPSFGFSTGTKACVVSGLSLWLSQDYYHHLQSSFVINYNCIPVPFFVLTILVDFELVFQNWFHCNTIFLSLDPPCSLLYNSTRQPVIKFVISMLKLRSPWWHHHDIRFIFLNLNKPSFEDIFRLFSLGGKLSFNVDNWWSGPLIT